VSEGKRSQSSEDGLEAHPASASTLVADVSLATAAADKAARRQASLLFVSTALIVLVLDQISKAMVVARLPHRASWPADDTPIIGAFFRFYHSHNTGVAFGMFQGHSERFLILALIVVMGLLWYQSQLPTSDRWTRLALGMQVGGALGNIADRLRQGYVTDFLDFYVGKWHWPTFNLADSAIVVGVGILIWQLWEVDSKDA
jgi:signal peptidase II